MTPWTATLVATLRDGGEIRAGPSPLDARPRPSDTAPSRLDFVDALKAIAVQLIVLHHLAFYGPMSDNAYKLAAAAISWLSQDVRIAVQAFLVIGGFLAARRLAPGGAMLAERPARPAVATLPATEDVQAFMTFPKAHRTQIYSTNPLERFNAKIQRRTKVVGMVPDDAAILRLSWRQDVRTER